MGTAKRGQKFPPIYEHSFQQAKERGEVEYFHASQKLNADCAKAINAALAEHYNYSTYCLDTAAASKEVVGKFGFDRTMHVLANTIRHFDYDGRISRSSKEWAQTIPAIDSTDISSRYLVSSNPGLTDMFVKQVCHDYLLTKPLKAQEIKAEAEKILSQLQALREPNSPDAEQFMVRVSPAFLERAKPKNVERLMSLLPFPSLKISQAEGRSDTYAIIDKNENRRQPLQMRKPSIKAQLAAKPVPGDQPAKPKDREVR